MTNLNSAADTAVIRRHVEAVVRMLLAGRSIKPSLVLLAGDILNRAAMVELCSMAADSDIDLVHLEFKRVDGEYRMVGINVAVPRDAKVYFFGGCQLSLLPGDERAVLMPRDARQGHFEVAAGEVIHFRTKPRTALEEGLGRAREQLSRLLEWGFDPAAEGFIHELRAE